MSRSSSTTASTTEPLNEGPANPLARTGPPTMPNRGGEHSLNVTEILFSPIPNATLPADSSGQTPPSETQTQTPQNVQVLVAGRDATIPLVYGGPVRMAGKLYTVRVTAAKKLLIVLMLCEGPVGSFGTQQINDGAISSSAPATSTPASGGTKYTYSNGVVVTLWDGTQTTVDPDILAVIPGITETYTGTAYAVCQVPGGVGSGFPRFTFEVNGLRVYDPRNNYFVGDGATNSLNYSTGDLTATRVTGDIDLRAQIAPDSWTLGAFQAILAKYNGAANIGYLFYIDNGTGKLLFQKSHDGSTLDVNVTSTAATGFGAGVKKWVRVTYEVATGNVKFYTGDDGQTWVQLGTTVSATASTTFAATGALWVGLGGTANLPFKGKFYRAQVYSGISGTLVADFTPWAATGAVASVVSATSGETWTPGTGTTITATANAWSANPALCLGDFITNTTYGARKKVDWSSVAVAAEYCDELVGTTTLEKRNLIALPLDQKQFVRDWIETLRGYIPAWIDYVGDSVVVIPDKPTTGTPFKLTPRNIIADNLPSIVKRGAKDIPNVVQVFYTRTDTSPWASDVAEASALAAIRRISKIQMPGILRFSQAKRFATERLNQYRLEDLEGTLNVSEDGIRFVIGDPITVCDDLVSGPGPELLDDPNFGTPADWSLGTGHSVSGNTLVIAAGADATTTTVAAPLEADGTYKIAVVVDSLAAGYNATYNSGYLTIGLSGVTSERIIGAGTYTITLTDDGTTDGKLYIKSYGATSAVISSISVKQLIAINARVMGRQDLGHGRWSIGWKEYDPASYNDEVVLAEAPPSTGLPDPTVVQAPTGLLLSETYFRQSTATPAAGSAGFIYASRIHATWTASQHPYPVRYRVLFIDTTTTPPTTIHEGNTLDTAYDSPEVQQNKTYTVTVIAVNALPAQSDSSCTAFITALGKALPPGDVPAIISAFPSSGEVFFSWEQAPDADTIRYEWRFGSTSGFTWDGATLLDRVDGLRATFKAIPAGTWRFAVKAIDSKGQYSANATTVDLTVTNDANDLIQNHTFTSPTLTNMTAIPMLEGEWKPRWESDRSSDQWGTVEPDPLNSGSNPVGSYTGASLTKTWTSEAWDIGEAISAKFSISSNITVLAGSVKSYVETSPDGSTYTRQNASVAFTGVARFVKVTFEATGTDQFILDGYPTLNVAATTQEETFNNVATSASVSTLVQLLHNYFAYQAISAQAVGAGSLLGAYSRVLLSGQTGLMLEWDSGSVSAPSFVASVNSGDPLINTTFTLTYPGTVQAGDFAVLYLATPFNTDPSGLSGWTKVTVLAGGGSLDFHHIYVKRVVQGETSVTPTAVSGNLTNSYGHILFYRNVKGVGAIAGSVTSAANPATTVALASITTTGNNSVVMAFENDVNNTVQAVDTKPANMTLRDSRGGGTSASWKSEVADRAVASSGTATGTETFTRTSSGGTRSEGFLMELLAVTGPRVGVEIATPARTILSDDYIEYDVFIDEGSPAFSTAADGAIYLQCSDGSDNEGTTLNDADGYNSLTPASGFDTAARGVFKSRKIAIGTWAGKTLFNVSLYSASDASSATHKTVYKNIRVTNGAGTDRLVMWSSGEPSPNAQDFVAGSSNIQCGPSNSMLIDTYNTSTGARAAAAANVVFDGFGA